MRPPKHQSPPESTFKPPPQRPPPLHTPPQRTDPWPQPRYASDESPRSPLRSDSYKAAESYYSPLESPAPPTPPNDAEAAESSSHVISFSRAVREETLPSALVLGGGGGGERAAYGGRRRSKKAVVEQQVVSSKSEKEVLLVRAGLGLRLLEVVLCLLSFSVMATDRTEGWSGDSFDRYTEYRFCLSINVIGFAYAAFQACELAYNMATAKHVLSYRIRYQFDFLMDQVLAYLIMSASSASASRIDDWQSNWGKDPFTEKASASVTLSFIAFAAFALSSLISGYNFCNRDLT